MQRQRNIDIHQVFPTVSWAFYAVSIACPKKGRSNGFSLDKPSRRTLKSHPLEEVGSG